MRAFVASMRGAALVALVVLAFTTDADSVSRPSEQDEQTCLLQVQKTVAYAGKHLGRKEDASRAPPANRAETSPLSKPGARQVGSSPSETTDARVSLVEGGSSGHGQRGGTGGQSLTAERFSFITLVELMFSLGGFFALFVFGSWYFSAAKGDEEVSDDEVSGKSKAGQVSGKASEGPQMFPPARPMARSAVRMVLAEGAAEEKFIQQVNSPRNFSSLPAADVIMGYFAPLPGGGKYDDLLGPGKSMELLQELPNIFELSPPPPNQDIHGQGYSTDVFSPAAIAALLQSWDPSCVANIERLVIAPGTRLIIVGDTHGQLEDVLWIFMKYGAPSPTNRYLFNGDFVDRSWHSLEILLLLLSLRRDKQDSVCMLRGSHEDSVMNSLHGFQAEVVHKFGGNPCVLHLIVSKLWTTLPIMAHVTNDANEDGYVVVHGGIPHSGPNMNPKWTPGVVTLQRVSEISCRHQAIPVTGRLSEASTVPDPDLLLLWSLLRTNPERPDVPSVTKRGTPAPSKSFNRRDTMQFCQANRVKAIVRSHQVQADGYSVCHGNKCWTVFSASNYNGSVGNNGAVCVIDAKLEAQMNKFYAAPFQYIAECCRHSSSDIQGCIARFEKEKGLMDAENPDKTTPNFGFGDDAVAISLRRVSGDMTRDKKQHWAKFMQYVNEQIVEVKPKLFDQFRKLDSAKSGSLPKTQWLKAMLDTFEKEGVSVTPEELDKQLFMRWGLKDPVQYTRFLNRFQISDTRGDVQATNEICSEVTGIPGARVTLETAAYDELVETLDHNGDNFVTVQGFVSFLRTFRVDLPMYQAYSLYEDFLKTLDVQRITVDGMLHCLASISREVPPPHQYEDIVARVRDLLKQKRINFAQAFRLMDKKRLGFLETAEIREELFTLLQGTRVAACGKVIDVSAQPRPSRVPLRRLHGEGFDPACLGEWREASSEQAQRVLSDSPDEYIGYQRDSNHPGWLRFASAGATRRPQPDSVCVVVDPDAASALKQVEPPHDIGSTVDMFVEFLGVRCDDPLKVSVIELIRATLPREFLIATQQVFLRDLLRTVWLRRVALSVSFCRHDPSATGEVSSSTFRRVIKEMNQGLTREGRQPMSHNQLNAIIASVDSQNENVNYRDFLAGLRIIDTASTESVTSGGAVTPRLKANLTPRNLTPRNLTPR